LHERSHEVQYRRVTDIDSTLILRAGEVTVTGHPATGARIGQIIVAGQPLLVDVPTEERPHPMSWGSFPMAPWAGRIREGRFSFGGADHHLAINHHDGPDPRNAHAIHGLAFDRPWHVHDVSDTSWTCSLEFDWEFGGVATQTVAVHHDHLDVTLVVESTGAAFPAEIGWHPWFRKPDRLEFTPATMYLRDTFGIPTGELVEPSEGPWDDCFVSTGPVALHYERTTAPLVRVESDCDHWVVYDHPSHATCVEPQSGPPDAFNLNPHVVTTSAPLTRTMTISW
jgi:aldose 1-epimerase